MTRMPSRVPLVNVGAGVSISAGCLVNGRLTHRRMSSSFCFSMPHDPPMSRIKRRAMPSARLVP